MRKRKNPESTPVEYLSWATVLANSSPSFRTQLRKQLLEEIRCFSALGEGHADQVAGKSLHAELTDPELWEFVGFAPNLHYIKETAPSKDELEALWGHPWGTPALVYKHKKLCVLIMTHAGMRFNKSYLEEMSENQGKIEKLRGLTG